MAASTASAQPGPRPTTSSALTVGPRIVSADRASDIRALARCSSERGTSCGMMLAIAGKLAAETVPCTTLRATSIHSSAAPVITSAAIRPWVIAEAMLDTWMTTLRGNRSAITPPHSRSRTIGMLCAARTRPRAPGSSSVIFRTANASATDAIALPSMLTKREAK